MFDVTKNAELRDLFGFMDHQLSHIVTNKIGSKHISSVVWDKGSKYILPLIFMSKCSLLYCNYNSSFSGLTIIIFSIQVSLESTCGFLH